MKEKPTLILAIILLGLVIYYSIFEYNAPPKKSKQAIGPLIFLLDQGDVKKIQVWSAMGKKLIGERKGYGWDLIEGEKVENWEGKINDFILSLLMTVEIDKFPVKDSQLSNYGLDNPRYRMILTDITDKTYQLLVGDATPVGTCVYGKFTDSPNVLIMGALLKWEFEKIAPLFIPGA